MIIEVLTHHSSISGKWWWAVSADSKVVGQGVDCATKDEAERSALECYMEKKGWTEEKTHKGFRVGDKVALVKEITWRGVAIPADTEGTVVNCTPDSLWDFDVLFDIDKEITAIYVDANEIRKVE